MNAMRLHRGDVCVPNGKPLKLTITSIIAAALSITLGAPAVFGDPPDYVVTIEDDYSYPQRYDHDYGVGTADIELSSDRPMSGETVTITAHAHNYGVSTASSAWGWYSPTGRSCWGEWDFEYPNSGPVDISYRCWDGDATVDWRVELDGVHLADVSVPQSATGESWKLVTIHDVPITSGDHTLFLGTYQMDFYPDYTVDWLKVGALRIEAETYDRMGGNAPFPEDWRGLLIWPICADPPMQDSTNQPVQIWVGQPSFGGELLAEDCVGEYNEVIDWAQVYPGPTFMAQCIENNGVGTLEVEWTPDAPGMYDIYVVVDPYSALDEIDEENNIAHLTVEVVNFGLDVKPGSCPNPFKRGAQRLTSGLLPVALVGTENLDVNQVDLSSLQLRRKDGVGGSVAPLDGPLRSHSVFEDVATPFDGEPCNCHDLMGDGIVDLSMKFKRSEVTAAFELAGMPAGAMVELELTGTLLDGTPFGVGDCIRLVSPIHDKLGNQETLQGL